MRKLISLSCLFFAQMVCQAPYAHAHEAAPPVGALAMGTQGSRVAELSKRTAAYPESADRETLGRWQKKISTALRPPQVFSVTTGRMLAANLKQNRAGALSLKWSPVAGAQSYVVQICKSSQCEPSQESGTKHARDRARSFTDLSTVTDTTYATSDTRLTKGVMYLFRIVAVDAAGRRGIPSVVVAQRVL